MQLLFSNTFWAIVVRIFIFDMLAAFAIAKLEIQIEGKYGWAEKLPTWRIHNKWTQLLWGKQPYTGYHFWLLWSVLLFLHLPFFALPSFWSFTNEAVLLANFFLAVLLEDFFWFWLNPDFGLGKFNPTHAPWHTDWKFRMPLLYLKLAVLIAGFYILAYLYRSP
jgi:hypothetical protein